MADNHYITETSESIGNQTRFKVEGSMSKSAADVCRERGWKVGDVLRDKFGDWEIKKIFENTVVIDDGKGMTDGVKVQELDRYVKLDQSPPHYAGPIQPWDAIEAWGLGFHAGNVVKYLARAGKKGPAIDDYRKALDYLKRLIELERSEVNTITYPFNLKPGSRIRRRVDDIVATVKQTDAFHVWLATDDTQAKPMLDWPSVAIDWEPAPEPPPKPLRPTFEGWTVTYWKGEPVGAYKPSGELFFALGVGQVADRVEVRYEDTAPAEPATGEQM